MTPGHIALALGVGVFAVCLLSSAFRRRPSVRAVASSLAAPLAYVASPAPVSHGEHLRRYHASLKAEIESAAFADIAADQVAAGKPAEAERIRATLFPKASPPPAP